MIRLSSLLHGGLAKAGSFPKWGIPAVIWAGRGIIVAEGPGMVVLSGQDRELVDMMALVLVFCLVS